MTPRAAGNPPQPFCDVGHGRPEPLDANEPANLAKAIEATVSMKAIAPNDLERVIVDSTVQEKAIAFSTDSRLLDVARRKLVRIAGRAGLVLRQTFGPNTTIVDLGYRGVEVPGVEIIHRGRLKSLSAKAHRLLKRRQAVEPVIRHLKDDCGLRRNWLKGSEGDVLHPVLCAAGYNLR
ncbi:MAG: hypothetical protein JSS57_09800 [Proteobacteria bacterium]|nr:hypothetical protein [Pseudomonadota bacterium]